jgi:hypothetical protein
MPLIAAIDPRAIEVTGSISKRLLDKVLNRAIITTSHNGVLKMRQRLAELIDIIYGFRKFIAFMLLFITSIVFRLDQLIDGGQWVDLMKNVALAFFAANGIEHFTEAAKGYFASKGAAGITSLIPHDAPPTDNTPSSQENP